MKKALNLLIVLLLMLSLAACAAPAEEPREDGRLQILSSNFPAWDFARQIGGERCNVTLLLPPGAESHSYEPSARDIVRLQSCDLLVRNGGESEAWLDSVLDGAEKEVISLSMLDCVELLAEEHREGMQLAPHSHAGEEGEHEQENDHGHAQEYDEHVWTSPVNAMLICNELCRALCAIDPAGEAQYRENLAAYLSELTALHQGFLDAVAQARHNTLIFADRFPVRYFVEEYGLDYYAAFPGCAEDAEPSARTVAFLIDRVREDDIPAVFYIEFSDERMADVVTEDTGCRKLLFHSCHNVSAEDMAQGASYLSLMTANLYNLKEALG